jgi:hypothetical protein
MKMRPKCFVAMPMSDFAGLKKGQWKWIYRRLFVPAIRSAGFDAIQSTPTRGSLVAGIIDDLWSADAVLADLTGQNANVFYELGVRHALRGKTISIAQSGKHIPFDLHDTARYIYNPNSKRGRAALIKQIRKLLKDILQNPDRRDNPVETFLHDSKWRTYYPRNGMLISNKFRSAKELSRI